MEHSKKVVVGSLLIVIFILVVSMVTWYIQALIYLGDVCSCFIPLPIMIPVIGSVGLLIGTLVYYLFSPKFEKRMEREIFLRLFNVTEAEIMNILIDNGGEMTQSEIVKITKIPKVRVFRSLEKLKSRGMIEKKTNGKTNKIILNGEIRDMIN